MAPLAADGALAELGLDLATLSVEVREDAWADDTTGITFVEPWDDEAMRVTLVRVGLDGVERWRQEVTLPPSRSQLYPRLSQDEGLGVVALWFTSQTRSDSANVVGDIHWFDVETGERDRMTPRRIDENTRIESWSRLVGYVSYTESYSESASFTHLDAERQERTSTWRELLRPEEQSWLTGVVGGRPTYSVRNGDDVVLKHGLNVLMSGGGHNTQWHVLADGTHGLVRVPGSEFMAIRADGEVLLDYAGPCRVDNNAVGGLGHQLWSGALLYDVAAREHRCLSAIGERRARIMGVTPSGLAMALTSEGTMVFSEPQYNTLIESGLEAAMWPRGDYLVVSDEGTDDEAPVVSVFNGADLRLF